MFKKLDSVDYLKSELISPHCWLFQRAVPKYYSSHLILTPARIKLLTNHNLQGPGEEKEG